MATESLTLHRHAWRAFRRLPVLARIGIVLALIVVLVELVLLSRASTEQSIRAAVTSAVREATGPDPGSSCTALSSAGLNQVLAQFGGHEAPPGEALAACRRLVVSLRAQASAQQIADFARGGVRSVQLRSDGSAIVVYLAQDRRLGAELMMSDHGGRWLIDSVSAGQLAPPQ